VKRLGDLRRVKGIQAVVFYANDGGITPQIYLFISVVGVLEVIMKKI
jgi:hypothetical protein